MIKDRTKVIERIQARIEPENRQFVRKNLEISRQISYIPEKKGWSQKYLAEKLEIPEREISNVLCGLQDVNLKTLSNIEVVLEEEVLITPKKISQ
jgi:ribosome-binding protein aMBF1 (putative translation factor)